MTSSSFEHRVGRKRPAVTGTVADHGSSTGPTVPCDVALGLTDDVFARLAGIVHRETGIVLPPAKRNMVVSRLSRRLRALGLDDFAQYCRFVESDDGKTELRALISAITTNVTSFFREPHHFETLSNILPDLANKARSGERVRIWSAACATGQEPYSIAVTILERWPDAVDFDVKILATDIDPEAIASARRGVYSNTVVSNAPTILRRYLVSGPTSDTVAIADRPRKIVRFEELNLLGPWPFRGTFDVIFCRNVVIYFDATTRSRLWARLADRLVPGGWLFVGHSETIDRSTRIGLVPAGITQYRRHTEHHASPTAPLADDVFDVVLPT